MLRVFLLVLLLSVCACQNTPSAAPVAQNGAPSATTLSFDPAITLPYLASDALEGRGIGTHGIDLAADYLADHFRAAGLKTLPGLDGYFQAFDYTAKSSPGSECALTVAGKSLKLDQDFRPLMRTGQGSFEGLVAFVGYGIINKTRDYDDYAGIDVKGKIVLAMRFEPMNDAGKSLFAPAGSDWSDDASLVNKVKTAQDHGAAALLLFTPPGLEASDSLIPFGNGYTPAPDAMPAFHVKRKVASLILGNDLTFTHDASGRPLSLATRVVSASGNVQITQTTVHVKNIVGVLPGVGPHADEIVVAGAHYDHLGRGKFGGMFGPPGSIFHGADDNASGTAAILELAQHAAAHPRPRTIVFCLFTAEEEGLIGSEYFANHPPIDMSKVVAMLNMDMVGRVKDETIYIGGEGTAHALEPLVQTADVGEPLKMKSLPSSVGGRGGLGPSDHMEFALKKIPILFLYSGMHADYHRPTDTSDKVNYAGISEVAHFADRILDGLCNMPRQEYDASADNRSSMMMGQSSGSDHLSGAALGVIPDYQTETDSAGVLIQGVRPTSAADKAGLQGGDLILQYNGKTLANLMDLADDLSNGHPGDAVTLKVQRGKTTIELHAVLEKKE